MTEGGGEAIREGLLIETAEACCKTGKCQSLWSDGKGMAEARDRGIDIVTTAPRRISLPH